VLANNESSSFQIIGIENALKVAQDVRVFGKPTTRKHRRMAVVLADSLDKATEAAKMIKVVEDK